MHYHGLILTIPIRFKCREIFIAHPVTIDIILNKTSYFFIKIYINFEQMAPFVLLALLLLDFENIFQ